ncbi:hypothetical protein AALA54_09945 [Oscillospiraceae bacterium 44-34]
MFTGETRRAVRSLILTALLGCCLWMAWNVPYTHDDWDWGLPVGMEWWLTGALNNRYMGSFFVISMTRSRLVKTLVMGGSMFLLPLLAALVVLPQDRRRNWFPLTLTGCAAMMAMPIVTWRQTYGWVSAFANFVVSGVWVLLLVLLARRNMEGRGGRLTAAALFPLALTAQLFAENLTVLVTAGALGTAVWSLRTGRGRTAALSMLAGALLGLFLMFYNPMYQELATTGQTLGGVRELVFELSDGAAHILSAVFSRYFRLVLPSLFEFYPAVWALVCVGALSRLRRYLAASRQIAWMLVIPGCLFCGVYLWSAWLGAEAQRDSIDWLCPWPAFRTWGAVAVVVLIAACLWPGGARRTAWLRLSLLAGALLLAAPFAVVYGHGPRCYFSTALLLLLVGLSLAEELPWYPLRTGGAALLLGAVLVFHIRVYQVVGGCDALRLRLIREAVAENRTSLLLPTEDLRWFYTWGHNPQSTERAESFRQYYGLPEETALIFLPPGSYELWPEISQEMIDHAAIY